MSTQGIILSNYGCMAQKMTFIFLMFLVLLGKIWLQRNPWGGLSSIMLLLGKILSQISVMR